MKSIVNLCAASVIALAFATPAFAQGGGGGELEGRFMFVGMDGKMSYMNSNAKSMAMAMKYAKPVKAGTIFFRSSGTLYMVQDRKMGGKMLFDMMRDSDSNR